MGVSRPRRSERRPAIGLITASPAAVIRKIAPMAAPLAPRSSSRSGPSTSITPANSAGSVNSQKPASTAGLRSADDSCESTAPGSGSTPGVDPRPPGERGGADCDGAEHDLRPDHRCGAAEHRPEQHADDRSGERRADQLAAALGRRGRDEPGHARRPHAGAADALDEARGVEQHDVVREREHEARHAEQPEPEQQRGLDAPARGEPAARHGRGEGAGGVRGREHACARLREVRTRRRTRAAAATRRRRKRCPPARRPLRGGTGAASRRCYARRRARGRRLGRRRSDPDRMAAHARTPRRAHRLAAHPLRLHRRRRCARARARVRLGLRADRGGRRRAPSRSRSTADIRWRSGSCVQRPGRTRRRCSPTATTTSRTRARSTRGLRRRSSRPSAAGASTPAAPPTTRATTCRCCTSPASWRAPASCP